VDLVLARNKKLNISINDNWYYEIAWSQWSFL